LHLSIIELLELRDGALTEKEPSSKSAPRSLPFLPFESKSN
jgi:hypothetical protein